MSVSAHIGKIFWLAFKMWSFFPEKNWQGLRYQKVGGGKTIPIATLSPSEWCLHSDGQRWEPFECFIHCEGPSHKTVSTNPNCWRERRTQAGELNQHLSAYQPKCLHICLTIKLRLLICRSIIYANTWMVKRNASL